METTDTAPAHQAATPAGGTGAPAGRRPENSEALAVRTEVRAGAVWGNHSEVLSVRTEVRAGGFWPNHSQAVTAAR